MLGMMPKDYIIKDGLDDMLEKPVGVAKVLELLELSRANGGKKDLK